MRHVAFAIPGDLSSLTGGYAYARELAAHLPAVGWTADIVGLSDEFPLPSEGALEDAESRLAEIPADIPVLGDGLAFGALRPEFLEQSRHQWAALVHHPLALETSLSPEQALHLQENERQALARASRVITTSLHTLHTLRDEYGVDPGKLWCAPPGTRQPSGDRGHVKRSHPPMLLTVASLTPRKAHDVLIAALARIQDLPWRAEFIGDDRAGGQTAARIRQQIDALHLAGRIELAGAVQGHALEEAFRQADMFVLPSRHEGYGMVFAEALAHGLPIVACAAGATVDTVPADAGRLVPPDDPEALAGALRSVLTDDTLHAALSGAALRHGRALPGWPETASAVGKALDSMRSA